MQIISLLFGALYEELRYMKSVIAISLARNWNSHYKNSRYTGVYCIYNF